MLLDFFRGLRNFSKKSKKNIGLKNDQHLLNRIIFSKILKISRLIFFWEKLLSSSIRLSYGRHVLIKIKWPYQGLRCRCPYQALRVQVISLPDSAISHQVLKWPCKSRYTTKYTKIYRTSMVT